MAAKSVEQAGLGWLSCRWLWFETQKAWFSCFFLAKRTYFGVQPNWSSLEWGYMIFLVPVPPSPPPSGWTDRAVARVGALLPCACGRVHAYTMAAKSVEEGAVWVG